MSNLSVPFTKIVRQKVTLDPGYSPLDWANLKSKNSFKIGFQTPVRISLAELSVHNTRQDAWTAIMGKVYNITPYLKFHPGGVEMLLSVAGKDGTAKFQRYHSWVNVELLLDKCFLGYLHG
eukprot:NODE_485_length_7794_cov_0.605848.p6 type:complete len:121 gc:universal NODE_485_length_7794_cov_0.605848:6358-5996(-)